MGDLVVEDVCDGVWCFRRRSYANCSYLAAVDGGVMMIDAGMDSQADDIETGLAAAGAEWSDVVAIVLTHWHNDHAAGASVAQQRSNAPVYCGEPEIPYLRRETRHPGLRGWLGDRWPERGPLVLAKGLLANAPRHAVDDPLVLGDGDELHGMQILATPGHTDGHIAVWDPERRVLFSGDGLAIVKKEIRRMSRPVTLDLDDAAVSMDRLLELEPAIICPGHRRPVDVTPEQVADARRALATTDWPLFG